MVEKIKLIRQHDSKDCGAACFSMICNYFGYKISVAKSRELTKTDRNGTNVYGIVNAAKKIKLNANGLEGDFNELISGVDNKEIPLPFIARIITDDNLLHFVVVSEIKNKKVVIYDPGAGKKRIELDVFSNIWTGQIISFTKSTGFVKELHKSRKIIWIKKIIKMQKGKLLTIFLMSLIISSIGIIGSFVFKIVMDDMLMSSSGLTKISIVFVSLIGLYILQVILSFVRGVIVSKVSVSVDSYLSLSYYNHMINLPISSLQLRQTGEYLSRFSDIESIRESISTATVTLFLDTTMAVACGVLLCFQNTYLFVISLAIVILYTIIVLMYRKPLDKSNRSVMEENSRVESWLKETIDGMETIKSSTAETIVKKETEKKFKYFLKYAYKNSIMSLSQDSVVGAVELVGKVIILWVGFSMTFSDIMTLGGLLTFYALLDFFIEPVKNLVQLQPMLQKAVVATERLEDVLDLEVENDTGVVSTNKIKKIIISDLNFRYGNDDLMLRNINMKIEAGQKVAIVGESGSGKTTLAKLLLRFYDSESGIIKFDKHNIKDISLIELRKIIAYVGQDSFLLTDTIRNNLQFGNPNVKDGDIEKVCIACKADEFINELPSDYDFIISENGSNLSMGQKQRLSIARALLRKPQLLILDEATSNLDTITEAGIKNTIFNEYSEMTCLIIAHRLNTIKQCDYIYVMDKGSIVEQGTHEELINRKGLYSDYWNKNE